MRPKQPTTEQLLEKRELFASIRGCGLKIDDSLLHEFQEQGMMLPPRRRGKGRGKGNPGLWTLQQRNLLYSLCRLQQRGIRHIGQRCNLPVWIWLYWGDEYGVGLQCPATPGMPEQLRLDVWLHQVKGVTVTSKLHTSPVMLPNGRFPLSLEIRKTITLHERRG
jgi:hypothetical protein